ncbi:MAG: DNA-protecting protein DprA, partial [Rhodospirillales bacterium]|nr:DNA-protecting protein DprA [Rhodospirillales bacterium]
MTTEQRNLSTAERLDWLRLIRSENVGPITFFRLLERFGSAKAALDALPSLARKGGRAKPIRIATLAQAKTELEANAKLGAHLVAAVEPGYPTPLRAIDDPPPLISVRGSLPLLNKPAIAIVGARNASAAGCKFTRMLAADLGRAGLIVVSGMARGVDSAAHEAALNTGTIAVLAGGVDHIYPPENASLYETLSEAGAIVAELPPGTVPQASFFPRRNRIISGLGLGVV